MCQTVQTNFWQHGEDSNIDRHLFGNKTPVFENGCVHEHRQMMMTLCGVVFFALVTKRQENQLKLKTEGARILRPYQVCTLLNPCRLYDGG